MVFTSIVEEVDSFDRFYEIRPEWDALASGEHNSVFLTWAWISSWVDVIPSGVKLYQVSLACDGEVVAKALFTEQILRRNYVLKSKALALHECLLPGCNLMIEHNGVLAKYPDSDILREIIKALDAHFDWDEIYLSGVGQSYIPIVDSVARELASAKRVRGLSVARYVDLEGIRDCGGVFLDSLSKKTRYKVKRYCGSIESHGEINVTSPDSPVQAQAYLTELIDLHQKYWQGKGGKGAFSRKSVESFHRRLIDHVYTLGGVQLLKVRCGSRTLGLVYSLVKDGQIYMIQSGYNYEQFEDSHPGYICLLKVIQYNMDKGYSKFDFLAGDSQYKRSLSNADATLYWIVLQRNKIKLRVEHMIRGVVKRFLALSDDVAF